MLEIRYLIQTTYNQQESKALEANEGRSNNFKSNLTDSQADLIYEHNLKIEYKENL